MRDKTTIHGTCNNIKTVVQPISTCLYPASLHPHHTGNTMQPSLYLLPTTHSTTHLHVKQITDLLEVIRKLLSCCGSHTL